MTPARRPTFRASPQVASIWSAVMAILPPSRMLASANSLITSAPSAFSLSSNFRICANRCFFSVICSCPAGR